MGMKQGLILAQATMGQKIKGLSVKESKILTTILTEEGKEKGNHEEEQTYTWLN